MYFKIKVNKKKSETIILKGNEVRIETEGSLDLNTYLAYRLLKLKEKYMNIFLKKNYQCIRYRGYSF